MSEATTVIEQKRSKSTKIKRRFIKQVLREKENGFVLDCLNGEKTKLKSYNSINDKYLNYFVIRVHPNRNPSKKSLTQLSTITRMEVNQKANHNKFQEMILRQKAKISSCSQRASKNQSSAEQKSSQRSPDKGEGSKGHRELLQEIKNSIKYKARQQTIKEQTVEEEKGEN